MRVAWLCCTATLLVLGACNPALNWREVRLDRLTTRLPCKPDQARREVHLGSQEVVMEMVGCEASGVLYAVSHVRAHDPVQVGVLQAAWRSATLANLQATAVRVQSFRPARAGTVLTQWPYGQAAPAPAGELQMLRVEGRPSESQAVQARLVWFSQGVDIFHIAALGPQQGQDEVDFLFADLYLP